MLRDKALGPLLRQFGEPSLDSGPFPGIATDWWVAITEKGFPSEILEESMGYPFYALSNRSVGVVLKGLSKGESLERGSSLLALFLFKVIVRNKKLVQIAWSAVKACCRRYFRDEKSYERLTKERIPFWVVRAIEMWPIADDEKVQMLIAFTEALPYEDKATVEAYIIRHAKPSFSK
jgi:hypothetical protein